ncbi:MAG: hypothetical protein B7Z04_03140 [Rhodobacterales bacterium 32-66-9]|nr:MAG: hypothetical protein B7Z04_03140 [Rhodobacterales bacterium 32-66-9]
MMFDGNIILISIPGGRVIDAENRSPFFLITLWADGARGCHRIAAMRSGALVPRSGSTNFRLREEAPRKRCTPMTVHPFPRPRPPQPPVDPYFQTDRRPAGPVRLRALGALDQMYAYFGSDTARTLEPFQT